MSDITYNVGVLLGRSPLSSSDQNLADLLVEWTSGTIDAAATARVIVVDPASRDRVITKAVARYMGTPREGITQRMVQVDDAQVMTGYSPASDTGEVGEVEILAEWWAELGMPQGREAFTITPYFPPRVDYDQLGYGRAWC